MVANRDWRNHDLTIPGVTATKPGSAMKALPGIGAEVVDDEGRAVGNGRGGYLVLTQP